MALFNGLRGVVASMKRVGEGLITLSRTAEGELRIVRSPKDVIELWKEGAAGKIVLVEDAGVTTLGPILPKLAGVVCTSGGIGSHLAIVSREFSIPALMGTRINGLQLEDLNRKRAMIRPCGNTIGELIITD
ncbi:MAG: PEP-utilizing enzyme [Candidatus Verstraetearchaeota archaeon]|nr:PEP-utilizing enzyme [Candidatus Verstraetearchaeota archaeon]